MSIMALAKVFKSAGNITADEKTPKPSPLGRLLAHWCELQEKW